MISYRPGRNLLEEDPYQYELQDVKEPELFRDLYSYDAIPKTVFNYRNVPMQMPAEIWITDTTFRDGQQSTSPFTVKQIVDIYKLMARLGGKRASCASPSSFCTAIRTGRRSKSARISD